MEGVSLLSARRIILQHSRIEIGTRLYTHMPITPGVWGRNEKRKRGSIQKIERVTEFLHESGNMRLGVILPDRRETGEDQTFSILDVVVLD